MMRAPLVLSRGFAVLAIADLTKATADGQGEDVRIGQRALPGAIACERIPIPEDDGFGRQHALGFAGRGGSLANRLPSVERAESVCRH